MKKCKTCSTMEKSYVVHHDKKSSDPVRIDNWIHYKGRSFFLNSFKIGSKRSKQWLEPLFYCGHCCSAIKGSFFSKEDYFMSMADREIEQK
tara:strand:- start:1047 stop:1319 length:273 start_codon:yes stop_codon:yes gene_type:complete